VRLFLHQLRADQLVFWRNRESAIFVYLFPVLLFLLLGTVYGGTYKGRPVVDYLVASLIAYGVANTAFGGLAIMLVVRRELGSSSGSARRRCPRRRTWLPRWPRS